MNEIALRAIVWDSTDYSYTRVACIYGTAQIQTQSDELLDFRAERMTNGMGVGRHHYKQILNAGGTTSRASIMSRETGWKIARGDSQVGRLTD